MNRDPNLETYEEELTERDFWDDVDDAWSRKKEDDAAEYFDRLDRPESYA